MKYKENFGVMTSITWNSNQWKEELTEEDVATSKYDHVKLNGYAHESFTFAVDSMPAEEGGWFIGYSPVMKDRVPSKSSDVKVLFLISTNHGADGRRYVVGMYGFPQFNLWYYRNKAKHPLFKRYDSGNFRSKKEDIVLLDRYLPISNTSVALNGFLPIGKQISQQGWNYMHSDNVQNLLALALSENPNNEPLKRLMGKLGMNLTPNQIDSQPEEFFEKNADSCSGIAALEAEMQNLVPNKRERVSTYIERGRIANKVKELTDYSCLVCQALGLENSKGFHKTNGEYYIEAHHVVPVARREKGTLSITNIITVCATHHRQFHYGKVTELSHTQDTFHFEFDGTLITIPKIRIPQKGQ